MKPDARRWSGKPAIGGSPETARDISQYGELTCLEDAASVLTIPAPSGGGEVIVHSLVVVN